MYVYPLQRDGSNYNSWKRTVRLRVTTHGNSQYLECDVEVPENQSCQMIDFLFSVVDSTIINNIDLNEKREPVSILWERLKEFGAKRYNKNLELLENSINTLMITDPQKSVELVDNLIAKFDAIEKLGRIIDDREKIRSLARAISNCSRLREIHNMCTVAGSDAKFEAFANLIADAFTKLLRNTKYLLSRKRLKLSE